MLRPRAARRRAPTRLLARRRAARRRARTARRPTPAGARASGSSPRPTRATRASCGCARRSRCDQRRARPPLALGARAPSCSRPSAGSPSRRRGLALPAGPGARSSLGRGRLATGAALRRATARARRSSCAVPGSPQPAQRARPRSPALELPGFDARRGRGRGAGELSRDRCAAWSSRARATGRVDLRRLRPPPDRGRRGARRRCASSRPRRLIAVFQPHLYSRTKALAERLRRGARGRRRGRRARRLSGARAAGRASSPASAGSRSPRRPPTAPGAGRSGGCATPSAAERALAPRLREGDLLVTIGAGDIFRARRGAGRGEERPVSAARRASSATTRWRG